MSAKSFVPHNQVLLKFKVVTVTSSPFEVTSNLAINTQLAQLGTTAHFGESEDKLISKLQSETTGETVSSASEVVSSSVEVASSSVISSSVLLTIEETFSVTFSAV